MIPRYQRILFWSLMGAILLMMAFLLHGCRQAHKRLTALNNATPIGAPTTAPVEEATLYMASDDDASITPTSVRVPLPQEPPLRARALLEHLLSQYSLPGSAHPLPTVAAVDDVFLVAEPASKDKQIAVINLRAPFADGHPSGLLVEDLTVKSIVGTLHAALPQVSEIRFLVDGQPRSTLAGHADLTRAYPAVDTAARATPPSEAALK